jgi:AcrR family transcriptional regulator
MAAVVRPRDPEATRERILDAALAEFAAAGFAGARIQSIAQRAGVNARMLYHYFGEKEDLFRAILRRRLSERPIQSIAEPGRLTTQMTDWFARIMANPDWVRLSQWEALELGDGPVVAEEERQARWSLAVERIRTQQAEGRIVGDLDPDLLLLALLALVNFPAGSPHAVRMLTGTSSADPAFQARYSTFLTRLAAHLMEGSGE